MGVHHTIPTDSVPTDAIPTVHSRDVGWLTAVEYNLREVKTGKTPNQIPKNHGQYNNVLDAGLRCNFAGGGGTPRPTRIPFPGPASLSHLGASINAVLYMHATPRPLPISYQFLLYFCL